MASYSFGNLRADLPSKVQVLTAAAAAESALRSRGYVISSSTATADEARVEAKKSGDGDWDKAVVESWVTGEGTALRVKIEPFGDEAASRAIMDAVLARLGR